MQIQFRLLIQTYELFDYKTIPTIKSDAHVCKRPYHYISIVHLFNHDQNIIVKVIIGQE